MATLYVANCTQQNHQFIYRLPEKTQSVSRDISGGQQISINNLSEPDLNSIVEHHRRYGMVRVGEKTDATHATPTVYQVDKPITVVQLQAVIERNHLILQADGRRRRELAGMAISSAIEDNLFRRQLPDRLKAVELSLQEDSQNPTFAEGLRVERTPELVEEGSFKRRNARRKT